MFRIKQLAAVLALVSGSAMAADFTGFYGQVGIGYSNITSGNNENQPAKGTEPAVTVNTSSANSFASTLSVGYMGSITQRFLLGAGFDYSPVKGGTGSIVDSNYTIRNGTYQRGQYWSASLIPATPIGDNGLLYGKVGYTQAAIDYKFGVTSKSTSVNGLALGVGYKHLISGGLYGFLEANYESYGKDSSYPRSSDFSQSNVMAGVGYKF